MSYYRWLRQDHTVQPWVISIFASLAVIAALMGSYLGVRFYLRMWRRTKCLCNSYKHQKTLHWHLVDGMIFDLSLTLFALSGTISLYDLPLWIAPQYETETRRKEAQQVEVPQLGRSNMYDYRLLLDLGGVRQITWRSYGGHPYYEVQRHGQLESWGVLDEAPQPLHLIEEDIKAKLTPVLGTIDMQIELVDHYDNYYTSLNDKYELPIYRISAQDKEPSCLYTNLMTGGTRYYSLNGRVKKQLYPFCHNPRIGFFTEHPTLRIICMLVLALGSLVVSVSGVASDFRYLSRVIRRVKLRRSKNKR